MLQDSAATADGRNRVVRELGLVRSGLCHEAENAPRSARRVANDRIGGGVVPRVAAGVPHVCGGQLKVDRAAAGVENGHDFAAARRVTLCCRSELTARAALSAKGRTREGVRADGLELASAFGASVGVPSVAVREDSGGHGFSAGEV